MSDLESHGKRSDDPQPESDHRGRQPRKYLGFLGQTLKDHLVAMLGEFIGTSMFLFLAFAGAQIAGVSAQGDAQGDMLVTYMYISLSFGLSLIVNVWIFFRVSGGLFNPAVSLALGLIGTCHLCAVICLSLRN